MRFFILVILIILINPMTLSSQLNSEKIRGVNYSEVTIKDAFWSPKIRDVATNALSVCVYQTEVATPRIKNYEKVSSNQGARHEGIYYDDSDVYKALEAIAYSLHSVPNPKLEAKADEWIDKIAAAQLEDGYLNTFFTLENLDGRWTDMERHEAYCAGHLIEAGVAYFNATTKRILLDVAIRMADHMDAELRQSGKAWVAGHQEIELALVKLYRVTENSKYLKLSEWFLEQRGHGHGKGKIWDEWNSPEYCQDALPIKEQTEITGHAVRAMYMYTGIADLAAIIGDEEYIKTMLTVWEDVVHRNTYVTGGIGSAGHNEGFDEDYVLPNQEAYCETCASVGMVFWNQRMNWLTGKSKYMDVLERSLYNSALDGISLDGSQFFYPNPLASNGEHARKDWFGTACCPSNISRLIASVGNYIYAKSMDNLWINLFISNTTTQTINGIKTNISLETKYPYGDKIRVSLSPSNHLKCNLRLRIPGWALDEVMPGMLYSFSDQSAKTFSIRVNDMDADYKMEEGYAVIEIDGSENQIIELTLPMTVRKIVSRKEVEANINRTALQYGPLIYCFEEADNADGIFNTFIPKNAAFSIEERSILDEPVYTVSATLPSLVPTLDGNSIEIQKRKMTAIPYYTWCNRGSNKMQVWMPSKITSVRINE